MAGLCLPVKLSERPAVGEVIAMRRVKASEHMMDSQNTNSAVPVCPLTYALLIFNKG